jgi:hypothetical protein
MNNADAIYQWLTSDALFLSFVGTKAGQPSIFIGDVIGDDVLPGDHGPFVIVRDSVISDDDTGLDLRRQVQRVFIYGETGQGVSALANRVRELLHRVRLSTDSGPIVGSKASGPVDAPTGDPAMTGRVVTVAFLKQE